VIAGDDWRLGEKITEDGLGDNRGADLLSSNPVPSALTSRFQTGMEELTRWETNGIYDTLSFCHGISWDIMGL
jgi:hypothetical protein